MTTLHWPEAQRWNDEPLDRQTQVPSSAHVEPGVFATDTVLLLVLLLGPAFIVLPVLD